MTPAVAAALERLEDRQNGCGYAGDPIADIALVRQTLEAAESAIAGFKIALQTRTEERDRLAALVTEWVEASGDFSAAHEPDEMEAAVLRLGFAEQAMRYEVAAARQGQTPHSDTGTAAPAEGDPA